MNKTIIILSSIFLLTFSLIFVSCKDDSENYSTKDIQGVWNGSLNIVFHGGDNDGTESNYSNQFTFGEDGTLILMDPSPEYITNTGHLSVSEKGDITGIITTTHLTKYTETTTMNWSGCSFENKSKIKVNMNWTWNNTNNNSNGYYVITGSLTKNSK
ncbi:MAG TPA: hypothetical protein DD434_09320 [Bacteroidales bacterium]|nr:hypothetical protein [Bacteroidales bacterium]